MIFAQIGGFAAQICWIILEDAAQRAQRLFGLLEQPCFADVKWRKGETEPKHVLVTKMEFGRPCEH
jgi:hypothetical protein